ncbi:RpiB/LacA/LacB family sugar-phosphate isomerase [[Mycoplasma] gypis]|uniref:RpiB/LacA/LacB family sugar-phosphate isomerase n=1 Tax=[Mycoplasma] gypis TaxID=92404 RepID=A0ABZ2RN67_9BACT|nr:RpiB/LacA/LacB family sugar-phosphate isomerase [[Mycoplasma] gypis]MBN0919104.1 RpiB/LacA/LacB family sugar-phosphate isomerase [[Mycoplasma] gypis]
MKKIAISSDHAGYELKAKLVSNLEKLGYQVEDLGPSNGTESVNYAEYGFKLAEFLENHNDYKGIGICGTGLGISYALNRYSHIRAARVCSVEDAKLAKLHNDANVLVFGGRQTQINDALEMFNEWDKTHFEGGRHQVRLDSLSTKGSK